MKTLQFLSANWRTTLSGICTAVGYIASHKMKDPRWQEAALWASALTMMFGFGTAKDARVTGGDKPNSDPKVGE